MGITLWSACPLYPVLFSPVTWIVFWSPVFWSPNANSQLIGKVPDSGKDWGQKEKRASEDEMAGWHHQCNGHELGQAPGDGEGQRGLACCSPWSCTWLSDWTATTWIVVISAGNFVLPMPNFTVLISSYFQSEPLFTKHYWVVKVQFIRFLLFLKLIL